MALAAQTTVALDATKPPASANHQGGHGEHQRAVSTPCKSHPGHGLDLIEDQLGSAKKTIDLALFVFSAQQLTNKLAEQISAGVQLRLLADPGFASRSFSEVLDLLGLALPDRFCKLEAGNQPLAKPLKGIGTPRLARGDKLHHKFAVIDNKK